MFTFALGLFVLGVITWWVEKKYRRALGLVMMGSSLLVAGAYAFLGSRFAIQLFGRLVVTVDLPQLMGTAVVYTLGILGGLGLAGGLFLWISGRLIQPMRLERWMAGFIGAVLVITLLISLIAIQISKWG
jgi:hypothetical protein